MERFATLTLASLLVSITMTSLSSHSSALSSCNGHCQTLNDCEGRLICIDGRCGDDPDLGTHICKKSNHGGSPSPSGGCQPSGTLHCGSHSYHRFQCSPPVTSSTRATLTNNDFSRGGDGGGPSECDGHYHSNSKHIVALSTGWYDHGSRCGKQIRITSTKTGRSVTAKVVDECDSMNGCDKEHAGQPPCANNIVDASSSVWHALGLDINVGEEPVTWSMA